MSCDSVSRRSCRRHLLGKRSDVAVWAHPPIGAVMVTITPWSCRRYMPRCCLVSAGTIAGFDSCGATIGPFEKGLLDPCWLIEIKQGTVEKWGSKPACGTVQVLGGRKTVAVDGVDVANRRIEHRPSVEQSVSGGDGSHGRGPVNGEDGIDNEDAWEQLSLMVAKAGSRVGVGLGVVRPVPGAKTRRTRPPMETLPGRQIHVHHHRRPA